ncbi:DUF7133 domain-containing protein [Roseivirga sp.]|uniref:DUF7133 domain-containing protein n=1 Tax=Roseivirga sp. TaxID=1964215 RepID=UPI003B8AD768
MSKISSRASACLVFTLAVLFSACSTDYEEPEISLEDYQVEEGFALEVMASEPFLEAPVSIDFDNKGRIWTAEMRGYMQTLTGESEDMPNGVISILEDKDGDGTVDHSKVFLDSLVLPRAIAHVYGGLLYAEPPNLWFVEIEDDKPGKKILVDSLYADEGNVEHQPNGLMMNVDNWIYNARSHFRYKRENGVWLKEPTSFRGQWGITKDNFGRLYYNNNSTQIMGDYALPNVLISNQYYQPKDGIGKVLTSNQRVYPLHATLVNRGYQKGVLDADSMLVNVTSSCGPLVYRGGQFPADYVQNAFVCAPEVNLIKRNLLTFAGPKTTAEQAYTDREFIASTDEGFRPVNLFGGPDGGMYVVDMHRGIIQHGAYMTSYLRERLAESGMDKMVGMGRILRVSHKETGLSAIPDLVNANTDELVNLLNHENGWVRDRAQQLLIHNGDQKASENLKQLIKESAKQETIIHALYALEGLKALDGETLLATAGNNSPEVVAHSLMLLRNPAYTNDKVAEAELLNELMARKDPTIDFYLISFFGEWIQRYGNNIMALSVGLTKNYSEQYYQDALISGLSGKEIDFKSALKESESPQIKSVLSQLDNVIEDQASNKKFWIYEQASLPLDDRTHGLQLYRNTCAACHGGNGQGVDGLAPPLDNSEYIKGSAQRLALVLLHGMKGPLTVNGKRYEMNAQMPGLLNNPEFTDQDIVDLMTYLSNAFGTSARGSNVDMIKELRTVKPKAGAYTEDELNSLINDQ